MDKKHSEKNMLPFRRLNVLILVIFFVFIVLLWCSTARAQHEHVFFTGDHFGVRWGVSPLALGYEWHIQRVSDSVIVRSGQTTLLDISAFITSAGIYVFYVRAWNFAADGETIQHSGWSTSLTHGIVSGVPTPWQIVIKLKPVGPLIVE